MIVVTTICLSTTIDMIVTTFAVVAKISIWDFLHELVHKCPECNQLRLPNPSMIKNLKHLTHSHRPYNSAKLGFEPLTSDY